MISPARENGRISPWPDKAVSRKVARYAKGAKQRKDFAFALLRAFATLRELFWLPHTFSGIGGTGMRMPANP